MRRIIVLIVLGLGFAHTAQAVVLAPFFNFTIVQQTTSGDATFDYQFRGSNSYSAFNQDFSIATVAGQGTHTVFAMTSPGNLFSLDTVSTGYQLQSVDCTSSNAAITTQLVGQRLEIYAQPYSSLTCTLTSAPASTKTPVLIVPGVLGSDIIDGGNKLWVDLPRMLGDVGDQFMDPLGFNNDLAPTNLLLVGDIVRKPVQIFDYSEGLINELKQGGYVEGQDLFTFPYDWRYGVSGKDGQGNLVNERALEAKIAEIKQATGSSIVDVVAHSTGGLLVKSYVMHKPAAHGLGKVVFVGVPNTGAPKAIKVLLTGDNFGVPWLSESEMKKISQNLPVVYDLAPSRTYVAQKGSFLKTIEQKFLAPDVVRDLSYDEAWSLLVGERGMNATALLGAEALHTATFDNFDMRTAGVDMYNIVGCKAGTIGQIVERYSKSVGGEVQIGYDVPIRVAGDGTVPLESATNVPVDANKKYYALKGEHGKMLSEGGIRQQISTILAGEISIAGGMTQDISACKLNGRAHAVFSPVDIEVVDGQGNRLGVLPDGSLENNIPNADFAVFGEHKFVYLPEDEGQVYDIRLRGTDVGTFSYKATEIVNDAPVQTTVFADLPVTPALGVVVDMHGTVLDVDANGDGTVEQRVLPSAVLHAEEQVDVTAPQTTIGLQGIEGDAGYFRSTVEVHLRAEDAESGVTSLWYSLDGADFVPYTQPVGVSAEGEHVVQFYAVDRNANHELVQTKTFSIDITPPELRMWFSVEDKDFVFTCAGEEAGCEVVQRREVMRLQDKAGNVTKVQFEEEDRRRSQKAEIESVWYNGVKSTVREAAFSAHWELRAGTLVRLLERVKSKSNFSVVAEFAKGTTEIVSKKSRETPVVVRYSGLQQLELETNKGDFAWSFR